MAITLQQARRIGAERDVAAPLVEARGLTKRYGRRLAVEDVSMTVRRGRCTAY